MAIPQQCDLKVLLKPISIGYLRWMGANIREKMNMRGKLGWQ